MYMTVVEQFQLKIIRFWKMKKIKLWC